MGNGYDFTQDDNENGYDFTEDDTELIAQEEARQADLWENLDENAILSEINGLITRVTTLSRELDRVVLDNNYEKVAELIKALRTKDLSAESWIDQFYITNRETFKNTTGPQWMIWFNNLSKEKQDRFRIVQEYYKDAGALLDTTGRLWEILGYLPLKNGFKLQRLKDNLEKSGASQQTYDDINEGLKLFSDQINQDWAAMERNAERCAMYYEANKDKMPPEKLAFYYYEERLKDYLDNFKKNPANGHIVHRGKGVFGVNPTTYANMGGLDRYTSAIAWMSDIRGEANNVIDRANKVLTGEIPAAEKACKTKACQSLVVAYQMLVETVITFAEFSRDTYEGFKEGARFPYCFMKKLSSYGSVKPRYSYHPDASDPWEAGTSYREIYEQAANAITQHCKDFVYTQDKRF